MRTRGLLLLALGASWMVALAFRLFDLQVRRHDHFVQEAGKQQNRVVVLDPPRGTIFDARGRELAVSIEARSIAANPSGIERPAEVAEALAAPLGLDAVERAELEASLGSDRRFVWVARKIDPPVAKIVESLELEHVFLLPESKRYFPLRSLAAPILGWVGTDNKGLAGLEYLYDSVVSSRKGSRTVIRDARFGTVAMPTLDVREAEPGRDLVLTIDATIQHIVERELAAAVEESGATSGSVVLLDPNTGAVRAMASWPAFDPNDFGSVEAQRWRNRPAEDAYEPGSTFKMVTLAAALEESAVDPLQRFDCEMGGITLERIRINDHHPFGLLTVTEILAKSSNVGAIKLAFAAGRARFHRTIEAFGFGRPTGIDLPSESAGLYRPLERWSALTPAYVSFGQGVSVTSLQMANAFAAIANGGRLLRPYVVASAGGREREPQVVGLPASPSTVSQVRAILEQVVTDGTATAAAIPGYRVAGKTGTAQKAIDGRYSGRKFIASFVGFAPIRDPALVGIVMLDEPWPLYHGGQVAAPAFRRIVEEALVYLGVPPEREEDPWPSSPRRLPDRAEAPFLLASTDSATDPSAAEVSDVVDTPPGTVPDFAGLTARQAVHRAASLPIPVSLVGHGAVVGQNPPAGTPWEVAGTELQLTLGGRT